MSANFRWATLAPALQTRNFRLFWLGQFLSTIGTSLQVIAEGWLIYQVTQSTFWLGMVSFLALLPVIPISLLGGVLIDRLPRRRLILWSQVGLMLQALLFGLLVIFGDIQLWQIILLYFLFGALLAIDHPARRTFLVDLVAREELANAVALNASLFNISNLIGFALGGLLITLIGAGGTMLINAATYLGPIVALAMIRVVDQGQDRDGQRLGVAMIEGIRTLWRQPLLLATIGLMAVVGGLAWPVYGMMPAFVEEVLGRDAIGLGLLLAAGALGALLGTALAARLGHAHRGRTLLISAALLPCAVIALSQSRTLFWAACCMVIVGLLLLILQSLAITLVQLHTADRVRGRVMTIYSQLHAGADTGGNMLIGAAAGLIGLPVALAAGSVVSLLFVAGVRLTMPQLGQLE